VVGTADGERVIVWHVAPREGQPVFLYFHGNGGSLRWRDERFRALIADGSGLVALSYRGYGGSSGRPTETGLLAPRRPTRSPLPSMPPSASFYGVNHSALRSRSR
jgi:pimeloyl-ACP methyl ester carboxylesterase